MGKRRPRERRIAQGYIIITENSSFSLLSCIRYCAKCFSYIKSQTWSYHSFSSFQMEKLAERFKPCQGWTVSNSRAKMESRPSSPCQRGHLYGASSMVQKVQRAGSLAQHPAALAGSRVKNKSTLRVSLAASWDLTLKEGTIWKVIKLWKDECLPLGSKSPQSLHPSFCFRGPANCASLIHMRWRPPDPNTPQPGCSNTEDPYLILALGWKVPASSAKGMELPATRDPKEESGSGWTLFLDGGIHSTVQLFFIQTLTRV